MSMFDKYEDIVLQTNPLQYQGTVRQVIGLAILSSGPIGQLGELCYIFIDDTKYVRAEIVGFKDDNVLLMAYEDISGIAPGCFVKATGSPVSVNVSEELLGRVLNGLGEPIDGGRKIVSDKVMPIFVSPMNALHRKKIDSVLSVGVRAIDSAITLGRGQRVGIFSGSGVGKSTLLGMIARNTEADINVIALVGERGREVKEFIENDLGEEGLKRSIIIAETSDATPLAKLRGAFVATTIAEYFRDQGQDVLLMMDSVTRFARAQREIGLVTGEPPASGGFTPSVFALLPKLLERAGTSDKGTITGIYTVLVEADDINDPISDAVRGILDGHIVLSRSMAEKNHYPAIDILGSISRLMTKIADEDHKKSVAKMREILAIYKENYDLINVGAYVKGTNSKIDYAISMIESVNAFLKQNIEERVSFEQTMTELLKLFSSDEKIESDDNINEEKYTDLLKRINEAV